MAEDKTTPLATSPPRPGAPMRIAGIVILLIGLAVAGLVYGLSKPEALPDELATPDNSKIVARDVARNYGQMGTFSYSLSEYLKDPAIRAAVIALTSVLVASGCFYIAHLQTRDPEHYRSTPKT
jgi:hypothetical protein